MLDLPLKPGVETTLLAKAIRCCESAWLLQASIIVLLLLLWPSVAFGFELPNSDPWYYQSREHGYKFTVPDKAQHFYGSVLLNEVNKRLPLPAIEVMGPVLSLTAGFMFEVWQDQKGIGFSEKDLVADAIGIAASQLSSDDVVMWLDYSSHDQVIMFNISLKLGK